MTSGTTGTTRTTGTVMYARAVLLTCAIAAAGRSAWAAPAAGLGPVGFPGYVRHVYAIKAHEMDSRFIQTMMLKDHLWRLILGHRVRLTVGPRGPTDHYRADERPAPVRTVVDPFREAVLLMASNSLAGTEVAFAMRAVRAAMVCSALQHLSLQGFLLDRLIAADPRAHAVQSTVAKWLERMLHATVDKLAAVDQPAPLVARMHFHVRQLLVPNADLSANQLRDISQRMHDEMTDLCAGPEGRGPYAALIRSFKDHRPAEQLNLLDEALSLDERAKDVADLGGIREIQDYHGKLDVDDDTGPAGFDALTEKQLKVLLTMNRIKMEFVWLNLPIKTLAESQWTNLFNLKALQVENENFQNL